MVKGIKLKEKSKRKRNQESGSAGLGTRIRATLARILIPGPGTDPLLRIRTGCLPESTDYLRIFMDFYGLYGLEWYLRRYALSCVGNGGELLLKIWIKTRKIVGSAVLLLDCAQVFYTSSGGGIGGPNPTYGALGSPNNSSRNLFYQI
jgi:hypothetical protein